MITREFRSAFSNHEQANIPGDSFCELCVFDEDKIGSDDLIGTTKIDIENRWLNEKWKVTIVFSSELIQYISFRS
jgi:hypothetical protein